MEDNRIRVPSGAERQSQVEMKRMRVDRSVLLGSE